MQEATKRQLAQAQIQLNQSESAQDRTLDLHKHTTSVQADVHKHNTKLIADQKPPEPIEPAGRAEPGKAFSQ
jgi:hypothetical protein